MRFTASFALAAVLAAPVVVCAQSASLADPANLRGERVAPRDGRELPVDQGVLGLQQMLRRLNTRASLLLIVAHPDDEDGGMLTYYSRGMGARVGMLTLNRGEGGQNAMTGDFEDALGLIRTQELLSADRYFGAGQMFGTEVDFGFSKTKEEAFAKWTHERVLYDAVRAVRLYRPLVIASVFVGGVTDGHGQHQVAGEIAQEVFNAAGDPKVFPELTAEGILPWQPLKVYARVPRGAITDKGLFDYATGQYAPARFTNYVTGEVSTMTPSADVVVHEGRPDSLLTYAAANAGDLRTKPADENAAMSYVQFARIGLGLQRSQIGQGTRVPPAGVFDVSYHRYGSRLDAAKQKAHEESFFDGIDTSLTGIVTLAPGAPAFVRESLEKIAMEIDAASSSFSVASPQACAPHLGEALQKLDALLARLEATEMNEAERANVLHELLVKRVQLNDALTLALGMTFDATATHADQVAATPVAVWTRLASHDPTPLPVLHVWLSTATGNVPDKDDGPDKHEIPPLTADRPAVRPLTAPPHDTGEVTRPYFFRTSIETPVYQLNDKSLRNAPQTPAALTAWADVDYRGVTLHFARVVHDGPQPVRFVPKLSLQMETHAQALPDAESSFDLRVLKVPAEARETVTLHAPRGWASHAAITDTTAPGETQYEFHVPPGARTPAIITASAKAVDGTVYAEGFRPIGYGNLPRTNFFTSAAMHVVPVDLKLPAKRRIGYLPGTGDDVPQALASVGLPTEELSVADLTSGRLKDFDTVILGLRTYNAHPDLHGAATQALLEFARNGGNVIVQYQTDEFAAADAPYPLTLGYAAEKVVEETAPVKLIDAKAAVLSTPNRITPADFDGWVEERGHGFLGSWDAHYAALTEVHDAGQEPQSGGLVTTALGHGHWTYCAFALYRQLPEAVPGAYRIFANLLDLAGR